MQLTNTEDAAEEGQSFAKRIVAEILDRSVTRYRNSCSKEGEEGAGGTGEAGGQKNNYINYDIAQTVLGSSKDVIADWYSEEKKEEDRDGSRTPTG